MAGKAGLRAGLIGAAALFVLSLISIVTTLVPQVPLNCICSGTILLAYAGVGVMAGSFLEPPRSAGAGPGAVAGLISGVGSALGWIASMGLGIIITGTQDVMKVNPQMLQAVREIGIPSEMFAIPSGMPSVAIAGGACCLVSLALGAGLGAIGGLIFTAAKPD